MRYFHLDIVKSLKTLKLAGLSLLIGIILTFIFIIKDGYRPSAFVFTIGFGILSFLPTFILWIQYVINDYKKTLSIEHGLFSYFDFRTLEKFSFNQNDILEIKITQRNISGDLGLPWFPWHYFFYTEIVLHNQKTVRLSFLTLPYTNLFEITPKIVNRPLPYMQNSFKPGYKQA